MKPYVVRKLTVATAVLAVIGLAACSSDQVIDNTVDVAAGTTKVVAKGAVGAGKLVYKGGKAAVGAVSNDG